MVARKYLEKTRTMIFPPDEQVQAGKIAANAIALGKGLCEKTIDGVRLDREIEAYIRDNGGEPALKGYHPPFSSKPYAHAICLSLDNEAVHGPPIKLVGPSRLITIDLVVSYKGWHADTARTFTWSDDLEKKTFAGASMAIFSGALAAIIQGQPIDLYGATVDTVSSQAGMGVLKQYCGHGIGKRIHMEPQVRNYAGNDGERFEMGRAYAVEPILANEREFELIEDSDGWTVSADCLTSHNEDTVFIGTDGIINLTGDNNG